MFHLASCYSVPRGLGDGHWPQVWDLPKIPPRGRRGIESHSYFSTNHNVGRSGPSKPVANTADYAGKSATFS